MGPATVLVTSKGRTLPAPPTRLIGREREVDGARTRLLRADVRLLSLTGPPGSGKTRLALEVAAGLLDRFAHDVYFIELAPITDPALLASAIAQPLGVRETGPHDLLDSLKGYLWDKEILLVLDNFEQILPAATTVADLLASCPRVKILVTSRAPLRVRWEHELPVPPLAVPDLSIAPALDDLASTSSVELFLERAQAVQPEFQLGAENASAVAEICVRLDGLPLSIELAAARSNVLPPQAMLPLLEGRLALLTSGPRDVPERHQTLRGAIGWSYSLLQGGERALFRRLGVFTAGCTLDAASDVCAGSSPLGIDVIDGISALVTNNLLRRVGSDARTPRFQMLETVQEYARECLAASTEVEQLRARHARYFLALAEQAEIGLTGREQADWLERLEAEHANLRAALRWLEERGEADLAVRLAGVLWRFWWVRGYLTEGRQHVDEILGMAPLAARGPLRAKGRLIAGQLALWQGDYEHARPALAESLDIARELGDVRTLALGLTFLGRVARDQGNPQAASLGAEGVELFRRLGDTWGCGLALHFLGLAVARHDSTAARPLFEESARLFDDLGDRWDLAMPTRGLGLVAFQQGDYSAANSYFERAALLFGERGDEWSLAMLLHDLGHVAHSRGDWHHAAALFGQSLRSWRRLGNTRGTVMCLTGLAGVAAAADNALAAARLFGTAQAVGETMSIVLEPTDQVMYERNVALARKGLSEEAFAATWDEGRTMLLEEAVDVALEIEAAAATPVAAETDEQLACLTPREREVAGLLVEGLTNRQIAAALVIAESTANLHVKHILGKLEFGSRAQVAAWAAQRGLTTPQERTN